MRNEKKNMKVSNTLLDACYRPESLYQMRLMLAAIAQIRDGQKITSDTEFEITAEGMADLIGITDRSGSLYGHLKRATDELSRMTIKVKEYHDGRKRQKRYSRINVTSICHYDEGAACVIVQFGTHFVPYVAELRERYKLYSLEVGMRMRSTYGIRLYEQCLRWGFREEWEVTVGEFREMMGLQDRYPRIAELKRNVVDPAMRDVNEFTEFRVRFGQRKVGRTITHFQFAIETGEPVQTRKVKGSKKGKPDSRQLRIRELVLEAEGLDRLIGNGDDPSENERELMKQREELQRELDGLRQAADGT
ncbi:replication initiation protein [Candidatus Saccharibacteria bacterium]|nr:replication initiation protein [Candidatus Saccharibacteria bacterium]